MRSPEERAGGETTGSKRRRIGTIVLKEQLEYCIVTKGGVGKAEERSNRNYLKGPKCCNGLQKNVRARFTR